MALTVIVRSGAGDAPLSVSLDTPRLVIGRGAACEVRLPDPSVSQRHASIRQRGSDYLIVDEGSLNGTFVGPVRLSPQAPRVLRSKDQVRVGRIWLEIQLTAAPLLAPDHAATKELALNLVMHSLQADGESTAPSVVVVEGPDAGKSLILSERDRPYVVGRGKGCALVVEDADASRRHVEFTSTSSGVRIRDLGAKNGTIVSQRLLSHGESLLLPSDADIVVGSNSLRCDDPVSEALAELDRAADERLIEDESFPPPQGASSEPASTANAPPPTTSPAGHEPVQRPQRHRPASSGHGWNITDYLVVLLALGVIALSLFGLSWLFSAD